ncbi:MAG: amidohydrolase family protein [Lysobacterales bacterium]
MRDLFARSRRWGLLTCATACAGLLAPCLIASAPAFAQSLFVNDATVHTMGPQAVLQNADILVRDGRVSEVGFNLPAPADAVVIEARGRPVTPGFFAGITQLGLVEIAAEEPLTDSNLAVEILRPEYDVTPGFNPLATAIPVTRIEGYSWSVLEASRPGSIMGGQGRAVLLDGGYASFVGDRLLFIDLGLDAAAAGTSSRAGQWMLLEQAIGEAATESAWLPEPVLTLAGRRALAHYLSDAITVFQVDRASDILQVLEFSARHGLHPVISGGAEAWMVADRLAEAGVPVLLDALANLPADFDRLGARLDNAAILHAAGVTIAFAGAGTHQARTLRQVAGNAVANGLPYEAGLLAMTANPAAIFELGDGIGTLQAGSRADLVIWSGDPLEVTSVAEQVVLGGKPMPMVSRQTLLRDRYLPPATRRPRAYIKP